MVRGIKNTINRMWWRGIIMDTPKEILIAYYNEINQDKRLNDIKGRYNKDSILNLLENIIDQLEEEEAWWPLFLFQHSLSIILMS